MIVVRNIESKHEARNRIIRLSKGQNESPRPRTEALTPCRRREANETQASLHHPQFQHTTPDSGKPVPTIFFRAATHPTATHHQRCLPFKCAQRSWARLDAALLRRARHSRRQRKLVAHRRRRCRDRVPPELTQGRRSARASSVVEAAALKSAGVPLVSTRPEQPGPAPSSMTRFPATRCGWA